MGCRVIKHPRELGRSDAITSLYLAAKKLKAEVLLTVPVGSNVSLNDAAQLVEVVQKDEADIAIGSSFDREAVEHARHEGRLTDRSSLLRAYSKKALAMISPAGTGSVVVEKEVLEFADQQGLRVREFPTMAVNGTPVQQESRVQLVHFETKFMDYVATKHPLVFLGVPSLGFLYGAVLETVLNTSFSGPILSTVARFAISLTSSPLFLASIASVHRIGSPLLSEENPLQDQRRKSGSRPNLVHWQLYSQPSSRDLARDPYLENNRSVQSSISKLKSVSNRERALYLPSRKLHVTWSL